MFVIDTNPKTSLWGGTPQKGRWGTIRIVQEFVGAESIGEVKLFNVFSVQIAGGLYIVSYVDDDVEVLKGGTEVKEYIVPIARVYNINFEYSVPTSNDVAQAHVLLDAAQQENKDLTNFFTQLAGVDDEDLPQG